MPPGVHCGPRNTATIIGAMSAMPTGTGKPTRTITANELTNVRRSDALSLPILAKPGRSARRTGAASSVVARFAISEATL